MKTNFRIGSSTDIHRFKDGNELTIGGVKIPANVGVVAHSDGDALIHAISEALLGAIGKRDLGYYFSDKDPKYADISSLLILKETYSMVLDEGYEISNIDSLVIIESVMMAPYIDEMKANIANILNLSLDQISVKATRGEKLGFVGKNEGYVAQASVLLEKRG